MLALGRVGLIPVLDVTGGQMRNTISVVALSLLLLLASLSVEAGPASVTKSISVSKPTLIAFMPPSLLSSTEDGDSEAVAHLQFAVEDTVKCVRPKHLKVIFAYADIVALHNGSRSESVPVYKLGQAIGAILVEPRRRAHVVSEEDGPSMLQQLLPMGAFKYWRARGCQQ
jgi:hypothetical protein